MINFKNNDFQRKNFLSGLKTKNYISFKLTLLPKRILLVKQYTIIFFILL